MPTIKAAHRMSDEDRIRKWVKHIPDLHHGAFRKIFLKALQRKSMKAAIKSKCQDCTGWQNAEIRRCELVTCPLWRYRPGSKTRGGEELKVGAIAEKLEKELKQAVGAAA